MEQSIHIHTNNRFQCPVFGNVLLQFGERYSRRKPFLFGPNVYFARRSVARLVPAFQSSADASVSADGDGMGPQVVLGTSGGQILQQTQQRRRRPGHAAAAAHAGKPRRNVVDRVSIFMRFYFNKYFFGGWTVKYAVNTGNKYKYFHAPGLRVPFTACR